MHRNYWSLNGKKHIIIGAGALAGDLADFAVDTQMRLALYMVNVLSKFYKNTKKEVIVNDFFKEADLLCKEYESFL